MKRTLVGMALVSGLSIGTAQALEHDWEWHVGDFYLNAATGMSYDKHLHAGQFNGSDVASPATMMRSTGDQYRGGMRHGLGYRQMVGENWRLGLELGMGDYGTHRLGGATQGASGSNDLVGVDLLLHYTGMDSLLAISYEFEGGHLAHLKVGGQRMRIDSTLQGHMVGDLQGGLPQPMGIHPKFGTRYKAGLGYEYKLKDNVGFILDYAHMFGQSVDAYSEVISSGAVYIGRPTSIPSIDTVMMGFQFYF